MTLTILVTGATGFLGSHLVKAFLVQGHRVVILKRSFSKTNRINDVLSQCDIYDIDQCQLTRPFEEISSIDALVHVATCYGRNKEDAGTIFKINTEYPLKLLEIASKFEVKLFLNTGTVLNPHLNAYALSKSHFVDWGRQFSKQAKIKFINLKLEHFFGAGDDNSKFVTHVIRSCLRNMPTLKLTAGEQRRDFIYVDDVVTAYQLLLKKISGLSDTFQEYTVGSGKAVTIRNLVEKIHSLAESQTVLEFGAVSYREGEVMFSEANIDDLLVLGWRPQFTLEKALTKTIVQEKEDS